MMTQNAHMKGGFMLPDDPTSPALPPDLADEPTLVDLSEEPTLLDLSDAPTLLDYRRHYRRQRPQRPSAPAPMWPAPAKREQRPAARDHAPGRWVIATALGACAVLLLSLISLLGVINLTRHTGIFAANRPAGQTGPRGSASTASPAPSPTDSLTADSGWLQVAPTSVRFGCSDHQRTQTVVLENRGPGHVHWRASLTVSPDQAGVAISPGDGELGAGESTAIQLQSTSQSARRQEVIRFSVTDAQAGPPASVTFAAVGCK
jgi:hypothetical protein